MLHHRRIGSSELYIVEEMCGPTHYRPVMLPDSHYSQMKAHEAFLADRYWLPSTDRLIFSIHLFVLKAGERVIVIDTGVGNAKRRTASPWQDHYNTQVLNWLEGIGAGRQQVTNVVHTHLHGDHVGWNTLDLGAGWEPTFPKATYHMPEADFAAYDKIFRDGNTQLFGGAYADSVRPIVNADLVRFFKPGEQVAGVLEAIDAIGHSPGQVAFSANLGDEELIFSADVFHSPVQVYHPEINSQWCILPDEARTTRRRILDRAAHNGSTIMPAHSNLIQGWRIGGANGQFAIDMEASPLR